VREIRDWLRKEAERSARTPLLEDALIGGRFIAYAAYRLRYFALRTLLAALLHALKIYLAFRFFSSAAFIAIVVVQATASLAAGFWWGSLEILREGVRDDFSVRRRRLDDLIGRWISAAVQLGAAVLAGGAVFLLVRGSWGGGISAADLFLFAILFRLALDLPSRVFHSGIYALRRVYRPALTIVMTEIISFATLLAAWPWLDVWSLPLASAVSSLCAAALLVHYTRRAYRRLALAPWTRLALFRLRRPRGLGGREWISAGAAYAALRLDGFLPLALVGLGRGGGQAAALVVTAGPLIRAGFEWVQLFYFDLKRLDRPVLRRLGERFERQVALLALPAAVFFWIPASIAARAYYGRSPWTFEAAFLLFFLGRGILAAAQMRGFARGFYAPLWLSGILVLAGHAAAGAMIAGTTGLFAAAAAVTLAAAAVARWRFGLRDGRRRDLREPLSLSDWLAEARYSTSLTSVSMLVVAGDSVTGEEAARPDGDRADRWRLRRMAVLIADRLHGRGAAAVAGPGRIIWFERGTERGEMDPKWFFSLGAGRIETRLSTGLLPGGGAALREAAARGFFGPEFGIGPRSGEGGAASGVSEAAAEFAKTVPGGTILSDEAPSPAFIRGLTSRERRAILADASAFASDFRILRPRSAYDVTAYAEGGVPRRIFIVDRKTPGRIRNRWRAAIRRLNLESALR